MRQSRIKVDRQDTWYHCYNRIAGTSKDLPFGEAEKEQFVRILKRVSKLYTVKVVAYQVMSNHFHLLVKAPADIPDTAETCRRYQAFHEDKRVIYPDTEICQAWQERCRDVSWFMRHVQQLFTMWYNRTRSIRRRGSLWADRFKHTILEDGIAVWSCWKYIENNPVRAGMVASAADYRFCSYGTWRQSGRHPFEREFTETMLPLLKGLFALDSLSAIRNALDQALQETERDGQQNDFSSTVRRRVRHWSDGLVIGSELFVKEILSRRYNKRQLDRHRMSRASEDRLYAWRQLRMLKN